FVDAHSHLTMPGGSHWIEHGSDPPELLREVARHNAARLVQAGVLWARDVGSPAGADGRALSLSVRQEMSDQRGAPSIRIAGTRRRNKVALVSTLAVLASWATFERTTRIERFTAADGKRRLAARREGAFAAIKAARRAGVRIAAGSDFGGGSVRAGHLAWEV